MCRTATSYYFSSTSLQRRRSKLEECDGRKGELGRYIKNEQDRRRREGIMLVEDDVIPVLPEWEEQIKQLEAIQDLGESP